MQMDIRNYLIAQFRFSYSYEVHRKKSPVFLWSCFVFGGLFWFFFLPYLIGSAASDLVKILRAYFMQVQVDKIFCRKGLHSYVIVSYLN